MPIETNKAMRNMYVEHMNKLENYAKGDFTDTTCYMCEASLKHPKSDLKKSNYLGDCKYCPLPGVSRRDNKGCSSTMRRINLTHRTGRTTNMYIYATAKSIRTHIQWMEDAIKENTDCELYWEEG